MTQEGPDEGMEFPKYLTQSCLRCLGRPRDPEWQPFTDELGTVPGCGTTHSSLLQGPSLCLRDGDSLSFCVGGAVTTDSTASSSLDALPAGRACGTGSQSLKGFSLTQQHLFTRHLVLGTQETTVNFFKKNPTLKDFVV